MPGQRRRAVNTTSERPGDTIGSSAAFPLERARVCPRANPATYGNSPPLLLLPKAKAKRPQRLEKFNSIFGHFHFPQKISILKKLNLACGFPLSSLAC